MFVVMNFVLNGQTNLPTIENCFSYYVSRNCLRKGAICDYIGSSKQIPSTANKTPGLSALLEGISISVDESTPSEYLPLLRSPPPTEPVENLRMTHHVTQIITELEKNGGHLMALGTCSLPASV